MPTRDWDCFVSSIQDIGESLLELVLPKEEQEQQAVSLPCSADNAREKRKSLEIVLERTQSEPCFDHSQDCASPSIPIASSSMNNRKPLAMGRNSPPMLGSNKKFIPAWRRENIDHRKDLRRRLEGTE